MLALALSPVIVAVTAYARPYALPLFLSLLFLVMVDIWLTSRSRWAAVGLALTALLLPLSRSIEPLLVLAATMAVLVLVMVLRRAERWLGIPLVPIGVSVSHCSGLGYRYSSSFGSVSSSGRASAESPGGHRQSVPRIAVDLR